MTSNQCRKKQILYCDDTAILTGSRNIEILNNAVSTERHKRLDKRKQASPQRKENKKRALQWSTEHSV